MLFVIVLSGRIPPDSELESMLKESSGPLNFTSFLNLFGEKMGGESKLVYKEKSILHVILSFSHHICDFCKHVTEIKDSNM